MSKFLYIKKSLYNPFLEQDVEIQLLDGYTGAVGSTWVDYESGMFLQLNEQQIRFHEKFPTATPKEVWELCITNGEPIIEQDLEFPEDINLGRDIIINKIKEYDSSANINTIIINGHTGWFDKNDRSNLIRRYDIESLHGIKSTTLWIENTEIVLSPDKALEILEELELYAAKCYDTTKRHINNVWLINDSNKLQKYNYKENYPKQLEFTI